MAAEYKTDETEGAFSIKKLLIDQTVSNQGFLDIPGLSMMKIICSLLIVNIKNNKTDRPMARSVMADVIFH